MAQLNKGTTYSAGNATVTIENLNALVDNATLLPGAISDQVALGVGETVNPSSDQVLTLVSGQLKKTTVVQALGGVVPSQLLNANNNLSDLANIATAKTNLSLNLVENKSSATIRSEITSANVTSALGAINGVAILGVDGKLQSNQVAALNSTSQLALLGTQALGVIGAQPLLSFPLPVSQGGTGTTTSTGQGAVVKKEYAELLFPAMVAPTFISPILGTPTSGDLVNCTNIQLQSTVGTLPVSKGGTGAVSLTGYVKGVGTSSLTALSSIPVSDVSGVLPVTQGGTGQITASAITLLSVAGVTTYTDTAILQLKPADGCIVIIGPSSSSANIVYLPDASISPTGITFLIANYKSVAINVRVYQGTSTYATIAAGKQAMFTLYGFANSAASWTNSI